MKKYIAISALVAGMLIGCGGGNSNDDTKNTQNQGIHNQTNTSDTKDSLQKANGYLKFTKEYLDGKIFYMPMGDSSKIRKYTFHKDTFEIDEISRSVNPNAVSYEITSEGYIKYFNKFINKDVFIKALMTKSDEILLVKAYDKKSLETKAPNQRFYFSEQKAKEFIDESKNNSNETNGGEFRFSSEWLNGKTLYNVNKECLDKKCSTKDWYWEVSKWSFTDKNLKANRLYNPSKVLTSKYKITQNGYIEFFMEPEDEYETIKPIEKTDDYISLIWADKGNPNLSSNVAEDEYFFFDLDKAEEFIKNH